MKVENLIKLLNANDVRYVIIGATAVIAHGFPRLTKDIDIIIEPTAENIKKTFKALQDFGYDTSDVTVEEAQKKKLLFRQYVLETDIHPSVKGISFDQLWQNKFKCKFKDQDAYFASLDDLIQMKKAAGRPKDIEDLKHLEEIRKQKKP